MNSSRKRKGGQLGLSFSMRPVLLLFLLLIFGERMKAQRLLLDCTDFDSSCQWLNANSASASNLTLVWYRSSTVINPNQLQMTTGTNAPPNGSYAIASTIVVDTANASQNALLVSASVPCQNNNGSLSFNYWTSPFVLLNICTRTEGLVLNRSRDCQLGPISQGPGPATIPIPSMKSPFRILVEASNFVYSNGQLTGGFAILDNVKYTGDYCTNQSANAGNSTASAASGTGNSTSIASSNATLSASSPAAANSTLIVGSTNSTSSNSTGTANTPPLNATSVSPTSTGANSTASGR